MVQINPPITPVGPPIVGGTGQGAGALASAAANLGGLTQGVASFLADSRDRRYAFDKQYEIAALEGRLKFQSEERKNQLDRELEQLRTYPEIIRARSEQEATQAAVSASGAQTQNIYSQIYQREKDDETTDRLNHIKAERERLALIKENLQVAASIAMQIERLKTEGITSGTANQMNQLLGGKTKDTGGAPTGGQLPADGPTPTGGAPTADPLSEVKDGMRQQRRVDESFIENVKTSREDFRRILESFEAAAINNPNAALGFLEEATGSLPLSSLEEFAQKLPDMSPHEMVMLFAITNDVSNSIHRALGTSMENGKPTIGGVLGHFLSDPGKYLGDKDLPTYADRPELADWLVGMKVPGYSGFTQAVSSLNIFSYGKNLKQAWENVYEGVDRDALLLVENNLNLYGKRGEEALAAEGREREKIIKEITLNEMEKAKNLARLFNVRDQVSQMRDFLKEGNYDTLPIKDETKTSLHVAQMIMQGSRAQDVLGFLDRELPDDLNTQLKVAQAFFGGQLQKSQLPAGAEIAEQERLALIAESVAPVIARLEAMQESVQQAIGYDQDIDYQKVFVRDRENQIMRNLPDLSPEEQESLDARKKAAANTKRRSEAARSQPSKPFVLSKPSKGYWVPPERFPTTPPPPEQPPPGRTMGNQYISELTRLAGIEHDRKKQEQELLVSQAQAQILRNRMAKNRAAAATGIR